VQAFLHFFCSTPSLSTYLI